MSEKLYDYPYIDCNKPFEINGTLIKAHISLWYDVDEANPLHNEYKGLQFTFTKADDESKQALMDYRTWSNIDKLTSMLRDLHAAVVKVRSMQGCPPDFMQQITNVTCKKTFADMVKDLNDDSTSYDDMIEALKQVNTFKLPRYTGRRDASDDGLTFTDICKAVLWPF